MTNVTGSQALCLRLVADCGARAPGSRDSALYLGAGLAELEAERAQIDEQLADLADDTAPHGEPALLDNLPQLARQLNDAPISLHTALYQAFDPQLVYNKQANQVTILAVITPTTPRFRT